MTAAKVACKGNYSLARRHGAFFATGRWGHAVSWIAFLSTDFSSRIVDNSSDAVSLRDGFL
jgi:hypothetical protein